MKLLEHATWQSISSGAPVLAVSTETSAHGPVLRLDYDFRGADGFVVARSPLRWAMPLTYSLRFRLRGPVRGNALEVKLLDVSGANVWRYIRKDLRASSRWREIDIPGDAFEFAWGPDSGGALTELGAIEFALVTEAGGSATLRIADLEIVDRPEFRAVSAKASSAQPGFEAALALGDRPWKPRDDDRTPWIEVEWAVPRRVGILVLNWQGGPPAPDVRIVGSLHGRSWKLVHTAAAAQAGRSYVDLSHLSVRFLRVEFPRPPQGLALRMATFAASGSPTDLWHIVAQVERRGWFPRWLLREQSLWTPVAAPYGRGSALINEQGLLEIGSGACSLEPMLRIGGRLFTWTDVAVELELEEGWKPTPCVVWRSDHWRLRVRAEALQSGALRVDYGLENLGDAPLSAELFLLVCPFQVTPTWQSFRQFGGLSLIHDLRWSDGAVHVDGTRTITPTAPPQGFGGLAFAEGLLPAFLVEGRLPPSTVVHDAQGYASGALRFDLQVARGECKPVSLRIANADQPAATGEAAFDWSRKLPTAQIVAQDWGRDALLARLTAGAHILITRAGPALQPGPRRYTRSWIRDGTVMAAALLRLGCVEEARDFARWFVQYQRADGFVPCCVDAEGIEPLVEHDSHGQLIALIADCEAVAGDAEFLTQLYPFAAKAAACIERLLEPAGLLPVSASHEGYTANPVHSYWDDFWAWRGLLDAQMLAQRLGHDEDAQRWQALAARLGTRLLESMEATRIARHLDYVPASLELADYDPVATANAIVLLGIPPGLDRGALERTFDQFLTARRERWEGRIAWVSYTPYEIRIIGALVRLGRRQDALDMLRFALSDRRPQPWNQWPEIAWHDRLAAGHIGDLPHTWISAEYALAVTALFVYEREPDGALVLAAGVAREWIEGNGVTVTDLPTRHGKLSYSLRRLDASTLRFETDGEGGGLLIPPVDGAIEGVMLNDAPWSHFDGRSVVIPRGHVQLILSTPTRA